MGISVVVNTYNSANTLEPCLQAVSGFDQIVICDMHSSDTTISIAEKYNCKIVYHEHTGIVEPARNFAISQVDHEWVLVVDSDEIITKELREYLYNIIQTSGEYQGWFIPRMNYFMDTFMHGTYPDQLLRFMKRDLVFWPATIHATPQINGAVGHISPARKELAIRHHDTPSISYLINKLNIYSDKEVIRRQEKNKKARLLSTLFSALNAFFKCYILKGGFKDGKPGFIYAYTTSIYKFFIYAKMTESERNSSQVKG